MTHQGRPWLTALTGFIALLMGFCEFYTYRIGWHPFSNPWNRARLLHVEDIPMVLAAGAATFIVLTLLLWLLEKIPPIPEKQSVSMHFTHQLEQEKGTMEFPSHGVFRFGGR